MTRPERNPKSEARKKSAGWLLGTSGFEFRISSFFRISDFGFRHFRKLVVLYSLCSPCLLLAATNAGRDDIPPLRPPRGELPPSLWEQNRTWVILFGFALLGFICVAIWWLRRAQPLIVVPPEVQARQALELLRNQPEDGALLSRVSQVLRHYLVQAFELPPAELTTTEFCALIVGSQKIGPELAASVGEFLRLCDQRKFAPAAQPQSLEGVAQALRLIELSETRRAELRQAEQTTEAVKR